MQGSPAHDGLLEKRPKGAPEGLGAGMKIRILVGFNGYEAGQVFDNWPPGMCEVLIGRGLIEEVKDEPAPAPKPAKRK